MYVVAVSVIHACLEGFLKILSRIIDSALKLKFKILYGTGRKSYMLCLRDWCMFSAGTHLNHACRKSAFILDARQTLT